eukprot:755797-Hanusia_phi.AAC.10
MIPGRRAGIPYRAAAAGPGGSAVTAGAGRGLRPGHLLASCRQGGRSPGADSELPAAGSLVTFLSCEVHRVSVRPPVPPPGEGPAADRTTVVRRS